MNSSTGQTRGSRDDLASAGELAEWPKSSVRHSSRGGHTPSSGLQSTSLLMESRFVGGGSSGRLDGTLTSGCGK